MGSLETPVLGITSGDSAVVVKDLFSIRCYTVFQGKAAATPHSETANDIFERFQNLSRFLEPLTKLQKKSPSF